MKFPLRISTLKSSVQGTLANRGGGGIIYSTEKLSGETLPLTAFSTLSHTSTNKTHISFHDILEAWKRYPFRAEPPCIGRYGEWQPPSPGPPEGIRWSDHTDITPRKGVDTLG